MQTVTFDNFEIPTNVKKLYGNRTLQAYIEESNKMTFEDIIMHHRSSIVFGLMETAIMRNRHLYENLIFNSTQFRGTGDHQSPEPFPNA